MGFWISVPDCPKAVLPEPKAAMAPNAAPASNARRRVILLAIVNLPPVVVFLRVRVPACA
jgi:hypothetical protein